MDPQALRRCDPASDPEDARDRVTGLRGIDNFEAFMKFLAPVGRGPMDEAARRGEQVFGELGCGGCHVLTLRTGPNSHPVFDRQPVPLYSDLLLHDIGTGDGIEQGAATGDEIRTPALWGLRFRRPLLHDGSAATVEEAIGRHENEAARVRERYRALPKGERRALAAFLGAL